MNTLGQRSVQQSQSEGDASNDYDSSKDDMIIEDMLVMGHLDNARQSLEELRIASKARAKSASEFGGMFEQQDQLLLKSIETCSNDLRAIHKQERRRYRDASNNTFEKSRRMDMVQYLTKIEKLFDELMTNQKQHMHEEYKIHERQLGMLDSALSDSFSVDAAAARKYLKQLHDL